MGPLGPLGPGAPRGPGGPVGGPWGPMGPHWSPNGPIYYHYYISYPMRSKAAYPPPRCVLDHKVNGTILASAQS